MSQFKRKLSQDRRGATAIEYGLIAAFIALAMVVALPKIKGAPAYMPATIHSARLIRLARPPTIVDLE